MKYSILNDLICIKFQKRQISIDEAWHWGLEGENFSMVEMF